MAQAGNTYTTVLTESNLAWGIYREPTNRNPVCGEAYFSLPRKVAVQFDIYNSNASKTGFGYNRFYVTSKDHFLNHEILLAQGCCEAGDIYAKQFSIEGDLKRLGQWFNYRKAQPGDQLEVIWVSPTEIEIDLI